MKIMFTRFTVFSPLIISLVCVCFLVNGPSAFAQFTATWPLRSNQTVTTSGAGAGSMSAAAQALSPTLFIPVANSYVGVTSGTAGDGQRCSPMQNDGNDGGWLNDGAAVEGRFMQFAVTPNTGFGLLVNTISFNIGNRSSSNLRASAYYFVGASDAGFNLGTGTPLGTALRAATSSNTWNAQYTYGSLSVSVPSGQNLYVRIYPYMTGSNTTGKYFCTRDVAISGTIVSPNFSNVSFTTPATCLTNQINLSWNGPANFNPATQTIVAFLKAGTAVTAGTPTNNVSTYTANTSFPAGTPYQNDGAAYCIYNGTGTNAAGDHSGLTITGLAANTTYHLLIYFVTGTNTYSAGAVANGTTLKNIAEPNNANAFSRTLQTTTTLPVTWTAVAAAPLPDGYQVRIRTTPFNLPTENPADFVDLGVQTDASGGFGTAKVTPSTATGYSGFTGLTAGTMYYFTNNTYTNSGACINYRTTTARTINIATLPDPVSNPSFAINGTAGTGTITWDQPSTYNTANHTTLVFVKANAAVNTSAQAANQIRNPAPWPTGYYNTSTVFAAGTVYTFDPAAFSVYNGDATSVNISGLAAGTTYHVLILTMVVLPNTNIGSPAFIQTPGGQTYSTSAYVTTSAIGGSTYTWNAGNVNGDWQTAANWTPVRTTPVNTDQLIFNTGENITPINIPLQTIAGLTVTANTTLNFGSGQTLTFADNNGLLNSDLTINSGSTVNLVSNSTFLLNANARASVAGTLNIAAGSTLNISNSAVLCSVSGTLRNSGTVTTTGTNLTVTGTGTFEHAIDGGTIPTAAWNVGSTCRITGVVSNNVAGLKQTFSNLMWDCAGQTVSPYVLGINSGTTEITDNLIVRRTNGRVLQLTSTGGQRDFTCGNYQQYGGRVAVTFNTNAVGGQRSLAVNGNFYVSDSLENNPQFMIVSTANSDLTNGLLIVGGNLMMRSINGTSVTLEKAGTNSTAQLWFNGNSDQQANFQTITGDIDFVTAQTVAGANVFLNTNATAARFLLTQGTFNIGANTLTINNAVSYPAPGTGTIGGSSTSNLTMGFAGVAGTLNFAVGKRILRDFTQLANNTTSLGTELSITAGSSPGRDSLATGATLNTNDNLILRSDANGTARIAQIPVNGSGVAQATINGRVTVERHLPMDASSSARRWRLLTAPLRSTNAPTINAAWQAGASNPDRLNPGAANPRPGYGTHITRSTIWNAGDGYDQGSTSNPSIFYYSNGTNTWVAPANTNTVKITDNGGVYMLFARGDRSIVVSNTSVAASPTTLDPRGELNLGRVTIPMVSSGFQMVGNPYASQIKLDNILFNDTAGRSKTVYLWDPKTLGSNNVGKFITCSGDGNIPATYTYTGNSSNYEAAPGIIESSGAFMVIGNGGNIQFNESDKRFLSTTIGMASRPGRVQGILGTIQKLYADLQVVQGNNPVLADGAALTVNRHYLNGIDPYDAPKPTTFNTREEISIRSNGLRFAVERRKMLKEEDTVHIDLYRLNKSSYEIRFRPENMDSKLIPVLKDRYLDTAVELSTTSFTHYRFTVNDEAASSASDRLYIVFKKDKTKEPTVKVSTGIVAVNPNPVKAGNIGVHVQSLPAGTYRVRLISINGQTLYLGNMTHNSGQARYLFPTGVTYKGIARLELINGKETITIPLLLD